MSQVKPHDPITVIQASAAKAAEKADRSATKEAYVAFLVVLALAHALGYFALVDWSLSGYLSHLGALGRLLRDVPLVSVIVIANLVALYYGIHSWRHRYDARDRVLPPFPPVPDLRFCNDLYIGSAYTYDGKQPGDVLRPDEEVLDPHVIFNEGGLFGNLHVKGGIGSGKTSTLIYPVIDQGIMKYPKPYPPDRFEIGRDGRYVTTPVKSGESSTDICDRESWNPYAGLTPEVARTRYAELMAEHEQKKWGMLIFDPKGDITKFVQQSARAAGRERDVYVLRPDSSWTYSPLDTNKDPLVTAEVFMDGIEAVTGGTMHSHYRSTGSEWMANALSIMKVVDPARVTFKQLLSLARNEAMRTQFVQEAAGRMREYQESEARERRFGRPYMGPRVNPAAIEFFKHWDEQDADPAQKRAVVSGIKAQAKFFVDDKLAQWLCPDMPPTFKGFREMIDKGHIVVFQMPLTDYGTVGRVLGILLLMDAQSAAMARITDPALNTERVIAFILDEVANYLNKETTKFISLNRQARVMNLFAHQSQGQLIKGADPGAEVAFNDNLRTKISYAAPNHTAAAKESQLFGKHIVTKERYSESSTLQRAVREDGGDTVRATGGETKGATISMEEVERPWFSAEDFMALETGQCVVSEFDGNTTRNPRKVLAPALYRTPRGARLMALEVGPVARAPHPVLQVGQDSAHFTYLDTGLTNTGYILVEGLRDLGGEVRGLKFVTEAGTLIVSVDMIQREPLIYEAIGRRLSDAAAICVPIDDTEVIRLLADECSVTFERVLPLPASLFATGEFSMRPLIERVVPGKAEDAPRDFRTLFRVMMNADVPFPEKGSWEYHAEAEPERLREIEEHSRRLSAFYVRIGALLHEIGDDAVEELCEEMLRVTNAALLRPTEVPEPNDPSGQDGEPKGTPKSTRKRARPTPEKKPRRSAAKSRQGRKHDGASLFNLDELNDVLRPTPFAPLRDVTASPTADGGSSHDAGSLRSDDTGSDRDGDHPASDLVHPYPDTTDDTSDYSAPEEDWGDSDDYPTDDDTGDTF